MSIEVSRGAAGPLPVSSWTTLAGTGPPGGVAHGQHDAQAPAVAG
jgi:hypothetical protein